MANSKPVSEIRIGSVKAAIWPNDAEGRTPKTVTCSRLYKDGEQWKTTQTFGRNDLLVLAKVADQTHSRIFEIQQGGGAPCSRSPPISGGAKPGRLHNRSPGRRSDPRRVARRRRQPQNGTPRIARFPIGTRSHSALTLRIATRATPASQANPQSVKNQFTSAVPRHCQGTGYASPPARKAGNPGIGKSLGEVSETVCGRSFFRRVRTVPGLPASTGSHRDPAAGPPSFQGRN